MRKIFIYLIVTVFLLSAAWAAPVFAPQATEISIGKVKRGEIREVQFLVENHGDEPLEIQDLQTGCSCTVADYDRVIAPGRSGVLNVKVDTTTLQGELGRVIQLTTNDPQNPKPKLVIDMHVLTSVEIYPGDKIVVGNSRGLKPVQELIIRKSADETEPLMLTNIETDHNAIDLDWRQLEKREVFPLLGDGRAGDWVMTVKLREDAPPGSANAKISFETGLPNEPAYSVSLKTVVARSVVLGKESVHLKRPSTMQASFIANVRRGLDPTTLKVKSPHEGLTVQAEPLGGRAWSFEVIAGPQNQLPAGNYTVELLVGKSMTPLTVIVTDG